MKNREGKSTVEIVAVVVGRDVELLEIEGEAERKDRLTVRIVAAESHCHDGVGRDAAAGVDLTGRVKERLTLPHVAHRIAVDEAKRIGMQEVWRLPNPIEAVPPD